MRLLKSAPRASRLGAGAAALALAAGSAIALSTPAAAAPPGGGTNYAYGITAEGVLLNIDPTPYVESQGKPAHDQIAEIPASPLVDAKAFKVHANKAQAHATVTDAELLAGNLTAEVIKAKCVQGGKPDAVLANLRLAGEKLTLPEGAPVSTHPEPNTTLKVPSEQLEPLEQVADVTLTLNKQVELDTGGIQVTALEIEANIAGELVTQNVSLSNATCNAAEGLDDNPGGSGPDGPDGDDNGSDGEDNGNKAPEPTPVEGNLAVTG